MLHWCSDVILKAFFVCQADGKSAPGWGLGTLSSKQWIIGGPTPSPHNLIKVMRRGTVTLLFIFRLYASVLKNAIKGTKLHASAWNSDPQLPLYWRLLTCLLRDDLFWLYKQNIPQNQQFIKRLCKNGSEKCLCTICLLICNLLWYFLNQCHDIQTFLLTLAAYNLVISHVTRLVITEAI